MRLKIGMVFLRMKKTISYILCVLMLSCILICAEADGTSERAVIGADLTNEQIMLVYQAFGVQQGSVTELKLTNAEERRYLEGFVDSSVIGTRSISCVYVEVLPAGMGMNVATNNITWCTGDMYANALATAGITDARVIVAAPFPVSGTAALAGVYKAYEDITGQKLNSQAKDAGTQELTVTGELAQDIGTSDSASIVQELKLMLNETQKMSDAELRIAITTVASHYRVSLTETQIGQLVSLCRTLEKLDPASLKDKVTDVQGTLEKVSDAKDQVVGFAQTLKNLFDSMQGFFEKLQSLLNKFG